MGWPRRPRAACIGLSRPGCEAPAADTCTHTQPLERRQIPLSALAPMSATRPALAMPCRCHAARPPCVSRQDGLPDPPLFAVAGFGPSLPAGALAAAASLLPRWHVSISCFFSSLPFTIRPPQPSPPVPPEPLTVPARREIGSERGAGILPQLTEPHQAQAALLPATSLGTGGRGAAGAWQPFPGTARPSHHRGSAAKSQTRGRKRGKRQGNELASPCPVAGNLPGARCGQLGDVLVPQ